ncbi:hypothetical protein GIY30_03380 [Gordonia sp. HNM0687]|uniref:AbiEi antitoxin C-terminal domain-containing protein n=1 Tax=Gordonia mangrovi TaxID=2665643 RepID=A0A6L7GLU9_9ACTN|nr:hypothetical protein [Gordonia mangrovi]
MVAASLNGGPKRTASHISAAAMHRIPMLNPDLSMVHFTSTTTGKSGKRGIVHQAPLPDTDIVIVDDIQVTSVARSVCDVARMGSLPQAVCVLDSALRVGVSMAELRKQCARMQRQHGVAMLRTALTMADGLSESVGESVSRVAFVECPLIPVPELQVPVHVVVDGKSKVMHGDFGWRDVHGVLRVVGEFDGRFKYHRSNPFGDDRFPEDVLFEEKRREDAIRDTGPLVVRWIWSEAMQPKVLHRKVIQTLRAAGLIH